MMMSSTWMAAKSMSLVTEAMIAVVDSAQLPVQGKMEGEVQSTVEQSANSAEQK